MAWPKGKPRPKAVITETVRVRPRDVRDMTRAEMEGYALELGMLKRALELSDDRLRQNIIAFVDEIYENA